MAGEWPKQALEEVAELTGGFAFKSEDYSPDGRFVLRTLNIKDDCSIHRDDAVFLPLEKCDLYKRFELQEHDTLFVMVGATLGKVGYVRRETLPALLNQNMWRIRGRDGLCDKRYLHYAFRHTVLKSVGWASGSARDFVRRDDYRTMEIPLPPLAEQRAIAGVLGALDDKIELNRRMNGTLESMARALFQSWFVDFDPVRAKLDGRQPAGLDPETAVLFPDSFEDSESGHIPKGWHVGRVAEVSDFSRSSINPAEFPGETFDHYSLPAYDEGRTPKGELGSGIMSNKLVVTPNSVLLSKLNPHIPRIWLPDLHEKRRSVCSTEFIVASTRLGFSCEFLFSLFTSAAFATTYGTLVTGTTGSHQRIRPESVLEMKTIIPPSELVEAYSNITKPMFDRVKRNITQSRTLATLRDALLPKLLSGELSVAGAEKTAEANL
jgi:type I restriction enzyme S subunit